MFGGFGRGGAGAATDGARDTFAGLLRALREDGATLIEQEVALAKAEVTRTAKKAAIDAAMLIVGGLVAVVAAVLAVMTLVAAVVWLIAAGPDHPVSHAVWLVPLITTVLSLAAAGVLVFLGLRKLKKLDLVPRETIDSVKETGQWVKDRFH